MALYAIGDVHGCCEPLVELLDRIHFKPDRDRLWFVGDLINRGPCSMEVLRLVRDLGDRAISLMGNHEARAVAALSGDPRQAAFKSMDYLRDAPAADGWEEWLRKRPFFHWDRESGFAMAHAGLYPSWSLKEAEKRSRKLTDCYQDPKKIRALFAGFGGPLPEEEPSKKIRAKDPLAQLRFDQTVFTRIRLSNREGHLLWPKKALAAGLSDPYSLPPESSPYKPWYELWQTPKKQKVIHGHWAAAGLQLGEQVIGLDTGCVYGGRLTAIRLDDPTLPITQVDCPEYVPHK
ncbi:MAG: symmetrical bis(5'-nucleosyl)-tetraphosphatase [Magnetococcales bacterium]|nr:symmetrical bis(5'-nucleosyl)-tetraphosphatase [Magnetococcales bacterium]